MPSVQTELQTMRADKTETQRSRRSITNIQRNLLLIFISKNAVVMTLQEIFIEKGNNIQRFSIEKENGLIIDLFLCFPFVFSCIKKLYKKTQKCYNKLVSPDS